jgi:hypothetical protein
LRSLEAHSTDAELEPYTRPWIAAVLGLSLFGLSLLSLMTGVFASGRCEGNGAFNPDDPEALPSWYCRATHLPGLPDTPSSTVLMAALFVLPVAVVLIGGGIALATRNKLALRLSIAIGVILAAASAILAFVGADIAYHYEGGV